MNAINRLVTKYPAAKKILVVPICLVVFIVCLPISVWNALKAFWQTLSYDVRSMFLGMIDVTKETFQAGAGFKSQQARFEKARKEADSELPFNAQ